MCYSFTFFVLGSQLHSREFSSIFISPLTFHAIFCLTEFFVLPLERDVRVPLGGNWVLLEPCGVLVCKYAIYRNRFSFKVWRAVLLIRPLTSTPPLHITPPPAPQSPPLHTRENLLWHRFEFALLNIVLNYSSYSCQNSKHQFHIFIVSAFQFWIAKTIESDLQSN